MQIHFFMHFPGLLIETVLVNHPQPFQSASQPTVGSGSLDDLTKYAVSASLAGRHGPSASEWPVTASKHGGTKASESGKSSQFKSHQYSKNKQTKKPHIIGALGNNLMKCLLFHTTKEM